MKANTFPFALPRRSATVLGAALVALGVAGCSTGSAVRYDLAYPITVERAAQMLELPAEHTLSAYDASRVDAFGRDFIKTGEGEITIAYPKGQGSAAAVAETARRLSGVGVPANRIVRGPYDTAADGERGVVVSYFGPVATPTECPKDPGDPNLDFSNQTYLGFGCAYQQNVAAMLADPRDAVEPRPATPPIADRRFRVLVNYALGEKTASEAQERTDTRQE